MEVAAGDPPLRGLRSVWSVRPEKAIGVPLVQRVLASRGITEPDFLTPSLKHLHEPALLPGLERAAQRILQAIRARQKIVIYADYDVDGVSAAAILVHMIRAIDPATPVSTYLPHRLEEGYGLNVDAISALCDSNDLIVSVDCGITAVAPAETARQRGIDLIITDHHTPPRDVARLPPAFAVVHPEVPGETPYPFPHLCGAGVAFKVAWRLATLASGGEKAAPALRQLLVELLALAAMGVIADVVPLRGENRILARFGLDQIRRSTLPGVRALRDESGIDGEKVKAADIGFRLGPRLNAIGRLGHAREALELLTTADETRAREIAAALSVWNDERRRTEVSISERATRLAIDRGMTGPDCRAIVLSDDSWHRGVVGICCSRLVGLYHRPTILLQRDGDLCHGSGRSIDGFDLHAALEACSSHIEAFGGHAMAAGLKVRADRLEEFTRAFVSYCGRALAPSDLVKRLTADTECTIPELDLAAAHALESLAPFGRDNNKPVLLIRGAAVVSPLRSLGKDGKHVSFDVSQSGRVLTVKGWNWATSLAAGASPPRQGRTLDLLISPEINEWKGRRTVEAVLEDLRDADDAHS